jgi:hypothetical protein
MAYSHSDDFHGAAKRFAAQANLDPNDIRAAYRGREDLLCERDIRKFTAPQQLPKPGNNLI